MKALLLLLALLFSAQTMAGADFSPLQRTAVKFLIEDSRGQYQGEDFVTFLRSSHLLTKKELKQFPEVIPQKGYSYVEVFLDDCVYDVAIVVIDEEGEALNTLYIDFSDRLH